MTYLELKAKQQKEIDEFPFMFAFNDEQFNEGMQKLGLNPKETDKICSIGAGGFIRKSDSDALTELMEHQVNEMDEAIAADKTGEDFIYQMFSFELGNYGYGYTYTLDDTLEALGISMMEIENNPQLKHGLEKALNEYR